MLNLFFPFLNVGAQPKPNAETSPDLDKSPGPGATGPEHGDDVAGHQPVPELQAPRRKSSSARAKHAARPTHGEKVGAGPRQTKRLKKGEARSENEAFGTARPEATEPHEARMVVEAGQPAAKKVERGGRRGRWVTTKRGRTDSASSLPAGQRWKRRLPRASW